MNKKKALQLTIGLIVAGLLSTLFLYSHFSQQQDLMITLTILVFLGLMLARLQSTTHNLKETLADLEFRKQALNLYAIVSVTDTKGRITYVNDKFCEMSQYSRDELTGKNHRVIKSGLHSEQFYSDMWDTIGKGEIWQGQVCNRAKDGSYYWLETTLIPRLNEKEKHLNF